MLVEDPVQLALPMSVHLVLLLGIVCVQAFRHPRTRLGRWRYAMVGLVLWSYLACTPGVANAFIRKMEMRHAAGAAVADDGALIVVLASGFAVKQGAGYEVRLDEAGWARTYAGIRLWRQIGGRLLFVGGPSPDGGGSQAEAMAAVARASGVPGTAVAVERSSRTTYENLVFSRDEVLAAGDRAWLVTSALHMPRAMATAQKLGLRLRPHPCDYRASELQHWYAWIPNAGGASLLAEFLHEWVGLAYYRVRGYAA